MEKFTSDLERPSRIIATGTKIANECTKLNILRKQRLANIGNS